MNKSIYVAGAISGQDLSDVLTKFVRTKQRLVEMGFTVFSPLEGLQPRVKTTDRCEKEGKSYTPQMTDKAIVARDRWYVSMSDIIFADLTGCFQASIGTVVEITWGKEMGRYVIAIIPTDDVIHNHAFVLQQASVVFNTVEEGLEHLTELELSKW